jgi:protocatechuate 3,4-dioxygenase, beta subunit
MNASDQPDLRHAGYASTALRGPVEPAVRLNGAVPGCQLSAPPRPALPNVVDLTRHAGGEAIGERLRIEGTVRDQWGRPLAGALLEIWQANAAGRYRHERDTHAAPLDPHFAGSGSLRTDAAGRYALTTLRPGAYPWRNHPNAWRPAHIHFSVLGDALESRLVTQMYFPGDPLLDHDPIFNSIPSAEARARLVAAFDFALTQAEWALGYRFDIVVGGAAGTPEAPT